MKSDFKFSNLLATVYRKGNLIFNNSGTVLLSPVGNKVSVFDLVRNESFTFAYEHRKNIARIALNPQENLLLSVDDDGRAILVNFKSRAVLHHFNFKDKVTDIKFSPDGAYFAVAVGRILQIWRTPDYSAGGGELHFAPFVRFKVMAGHYGVITSLTWSRDSRFVLTCSKDLTVRLYSLHSEEKAVAMTFAGHRDYPVGAWFSEDQESIYTVSKDGALFTWKYTTKPRDDGEEEAEQEENKAQEQADGSTLSWRIVKKSFFMNDAKVRSATFHAATNLLVVGFSSGTFGLYELPEFSLIQRLSISQNEINTVAVNASGEWLAFGSSALGQLLVWEWQSESYILKQQGHFDSMNALVYSPDGSRIVTASDDGKIKVWDTQSGFCLVTFAEHTSGVTALQFAKRGHVLFSASLDGTVRAWDLVRYRNFRVFTAAERVQFTSLAVDPSGEIVCAGSLDQFDIHVWSVQTAQLLDTLAGHEGPVSSLSFSGESGVLASGSWDKTVRVWNVFGRRTIVEPFEINSDVLCVSMRPDGKQVAASSMDGQISIWDIESGKQVGAIDGRIDIIGGRYVNDRFVAKNSFRSKYFTTIEYSFDGTVIAAGGNCNSLCLYDVENEVLLRRFVISRNMTLDGTQQQLNSKNLTEAGPMELIDRTGELSDLEDRLDHTLPGSARSGDASERRTRPEIRTSGVAFTPTGSAFAAACTEGLLVYSLDDRVVFDPFDITVDITPAGVVECLENKEYIEALVMAFRLNETYLMKQVYLAIPLKDVELVAAAFPVVYLSRFLQFLASESLDSPHLEFNLRWVKALLAVHGPYIASRRREFLGSLRGVQRFVQRKAKDVARVGVANVHMYKYLKAGESKVATEEAEEEEEEEEDSEMGGEGLMGLDTSDDEDEEEGWLVPDSKSEQVQGKSRKGEDSGSGESDESSDEEDEMEQESDSDME